MGDIETDEDDRPLDPPVLETIRILANPFDDIMPRKGHGKAAGAKEDGEESEAKKRKRKRKAVKVRAPTPPAPRPSTFHLPPPPSTFHHTAPSTAPRHHP